MDCEKSEIVPVEEPTWPPTKEEIDALVPQPKRATKWGKRTMGIPWTKIEEAMIAGENPNDVSKKYNVPYNTIRVHCSRHKICVPTQRMIRVVSKNMEKAVQSAAEKVAKSWLEKGEEHRQDAFNVAHESLKKFQAKAPRTFRELESADRIARRAAGLETADVIQQTLVNVNEAINDFDQPQEAVLESFEHPMEIETAPLEQSGPNSNSAQEQ